MFQHSFTERTVPVSVSGKPLRAQRLKKIKVVLRIEIFKRD